MQTVCFDGHVQGASHVAANKVCQDFSGSCQVDGSRGSCYVAVVADGHGDPVCKRSDRGSQFAVDVVLGEFGDLARSYANADDQEHVAKRAALLDDAYRVATSHEVATQIVDAWTRKVYEDFEQDPIEDFPQGEDEVDDRRRKKAIRKLYGTTVVGALVLPDVCVLVQQGDGCSSVIYCGGEHDTLARGDVVPEDELCVGNVTTSLSDSDARKRLRVVVIDTVRDPLAAVFVGTDGVDKSLPREDGAPNLFSGIALDVLERSEAGRWDEDQFSDDLMDVLKRLSQSGSGDDASLAGVVDCDATREVERRLRDERDCFDLRTSLANDKARLASMTRKREYYLTMVPHSEQQAKEQEEYLHSYDRLAKRIEATERDLGIAQERQAAEAMAMAQASDNEANEVPVSDSDSEFQDAFLLAGEDSREVVEATDHVDPLDATALDSYSGLVSDATLDATSDSMKHARITVQETRRTPRWLVAVVLVLAVVFVALSAWLILRPGGIGFNFETDSVTIDSQGNEISLSGNDEMSGQEEPDDSGMGGPENSGVGVSPADGGMAGSGGLPGLSAFGNESAGSSPRRAEPQEELSETQFGDAAGTNDMTSTAGGQDDEGIAPESGSYQEGSNSH